MQKKYHTIAVTAQLGKEIKILAAKEGKTIGALIRDAIKAYKDAKGV